MTNNPYISLVQQDLNQEPREPLEPKEPANPYADIVREDVGQVKTRLAQSIQATEDSTPEDVAKVKDLSAQSGVPWSIAKDTRNELESRLSQQKLNAEVSALPVNVQDWLAEDGNIGIVKDDLPRLRALVDAVQNKAWYEQTFAERNLINPLRSALVNLRQAGAMTTGAPGINRFDLYGEVDTALAQGGREAALKLIGDRDSELAGTALKADLLRYVGADDEERQELRAMVNESIADSAQSVAESERDRATIPQDPALARAVQEDTAGAVLGAVADDPGIIARVGIESLGVSVPSLIAGAAGGPVGMAASSFGTERGIKLVDVLREAGIDTTNPEALIQAFTNPEIMEEAVKRAELKALGVSALDLVGAGIAGRTLAPSKIGSKTLSSAQREAINMFAQMPVQGAQEAAGEAAGQLLADGEISAAEVTLEAIGGAFGSTAEVLTFSGGRVVDSFMKRANQYRRAQKDKGYLSEIKDAVQQTSLKDRSPDALKALIDRVAENGPVNELYIDATEFRELFQSANLDPQEFAQKMESVSEQYYEGMLIGGDIRISLSDFARYVAPTEIADEFIARSRTDTTGMSPAEADAWMKQEARPMLDAIVNFKEDSAGASGEAVFNDVVGQLVGTGMDRSTAERNAALYRAFFSVVGEQEGVDPKDLYDSYNLKISRPMPEVLKRSGNNVDALDPLLDRLRSGDIPRQSDIFGTSLTDFLREKGGIRDDGGELAARDADADRKAFTRKLIQEQGRTLDEAAELAAEAGYIQERDINALIDAIDRELRGNTVYAAGTENAQLQQLGADLAVIQEELDRLGLDLSAMTNAEIKESLSKVAYEDSDIAAEVELNQSLPDALEVDGVERPTTNSNGQRIAQTEEGIRNFWRWFGESKVVDDQGRPLVVYHATDEQFDAFDFSKLGEYTRQNTDAKEAAVMAEIGVWTNTEKLSTRTVQKQDMELNLAINNPLVIRFDDLWDLAGQYETGNDLRDALADDGYDGLEVDDTEFGGTSYVAFSPDQIKSAIGNRGTFDPESTNILEQRITDDKRGVIKIDRTNRRFNIELLEKADLSTFLHESGHFFLEVMSDLAERDGATDGLKSDYQALLNWFGVDSRKQIGVDQHEQFARGFEAYLMEGRAPSPELQSVFARFRAWLLSIYKRLSALNVELTDEVRGVFDRLLATDEQIEAAREGASIDKLLGAVEALGWNSQEKQQYAELVKQAREDAKAELTKAQMADLRKVEQEWYKREAQAVRKEVLDEMNRTPVYVALSHLQRGKLPDGSPLPEGAEPVKLNKKALVDTYGEDFLRRLPGPQNAEHKGAYLYSREGGADHDLLASLYGFSSGDEMIMALANARPMNEVIQAETESKMRERYPDINLSGEAAEVAIKAIHNDKQAELLLLDLKKLHGRSSGQSRPMTPAQVMRQSAAAMIRTTRVRDLRPDLFRRAEAKAGKAAFEAATKGNYDEAYRQKQNQLMNLYLYRESVKAREESEKALDYVQKFNKKTTRERIGKAGGSYLEQIDAIIDQYEFRRVSVKQLNKRDSLRTWMEKQNNAGNPIDLPEYVVEQTERKNYRDLSAEELAAVREAIENIEHVATVKNRLLKDRKKREVEQAREEIANSIRENANRKARQAIESHLPAENARFFVADYLASHRRLSSLIREMDGGQDMGTMWDLIMRPINVAADAEADMIAKSNDKLAELFKTYKPGELRKFFNKKYIPEIDNSLTKQGMIMVALNTGTEDNYQKLKDGYGWSDFQVQSIVKNLDQRDWDFVQGIWDHINSYWPEIEAKEKRVKGVAPAKVEAMQVMTPFGMYRGGYFPLKYDERQEVGAYSDRIKEAAESAMRGAFSAATTRRGHTKERVQGVKRKIKLDFGVVFSHLTEVIHDLTHHEMLMDVSRLLKGDDVKQALVDHYGMPVYQAIDSAIIDVAAGDVPAIHAHERALQHLRNGVTVAGMGWNVATAMLQPLGFTNSIVRIGPKWVAQGLKRWMTSAKAMEGTAQWITEVSPFMRNRFTTQNREINDIRNKIKGKGQLSGVQDSFFWMITRMQMVVDIPTWLGAYEKAKAQGAIEVDAYAAADQAVIDAQGGGQIKDLAQIQRGHPALKLFTNFISYFVTTWNLLAESYRGKDFSKPKDIGRFAADFLLLYTVPAVLGFMIKGSLKGFEDDDLDNLGKTLAAEQLSFFIGGFFGVREFGSAVTGFFGYSGPAGTRFFNEGSRVITQAQQGELDAPLAKSLNSTAGILFHYPAGQVQRTVEGFDALLEGDTSNPMALLLGPPKDK